MKDLIVTLALLMLGIFLAGLILSETGLLGAAKGLFLNQVQYLTQ